MRRSHSKGLTLDSQKTVEDVLRALPIQISPDSNAIPYDAVIPGIAREILLSRGHANFDWTRREKRHATSVVDRVFHDLHILSQIGAALRVSNILAPLHKFKSEIANIPTTGRGRRQSIEARRVTDVAAKHYVRLTGNNPTIVVANHKAGGPFLEFLANLYAALDMTASPESQARLLRAEWNQRS